MLSYSAEYARVNRMVDRAAAPAPAACGAIFYKSYAAQMLLLAKVLLNSPNASETSLSEVSVDVVVLAQRSRLMIDF